MSEKRVLIRAESSTELSIRRRCEIVGLARSSQYYDPVDIDAETLALMRKLDELALQHPYWGSRNVVLELRSTGIVCNRKRVQRLRRLMGIESVAPKPNLSKPRKNHVKYPYLLRGLCIDRPNQVWAADISVLQKAA